MAGDDVPSGERVGRGRIDADAVAAPGATDIDPHVGVADPAVGARSGEGRAGLVGADVIARDGVVVTGDDLDALGQPGDDVPLEIVVHPVAVGPDQVRTGIIMNVYADSVEVRRQVPGAGGVQA